MLFSILEEIPYLSAIFKIVNKTFKEYLNIKEALSEPSSKNNSILMEKYLNAYTVIPHLFLILKISKQLILVHGRDCTVSFGILIISALY